MKVVEDCAFINYTACAISDNCLDGPYWKITRCIFNGANYTTCMGIALSGLTDGCAITHNEFLANRVHVKLCSGGPNTYISNCDFLRFGPTAGDPRVDIWCVPVGTFTDDAGSGLVIRDCKFGNEALNAADWRIIYADSYSVQTVTINGSPTGGTFTLTYGGQTTSAIAYNASAATVQSALTALTTIGSSNAVVSGSPGGPYTVTFLGPVGAPTVTPLTAASSLTGGTSPSITTGYAQYWGDQMPQLGTASSGWIYGHTVSNVLHNGINNTIPLIYSMTPNLQACLYGPITQGGTTTYAPILTFQDATGFAPGTCIVGPLINGTINQLATPPPTLVTAASGTLTGQPLSLAVAASSLLARPGTNMVYSPNFENPQAWQNATASNNGVNCAISSAQSYNGTQSMAITSTGTYQQLNLCTDTYGDAVYVETTAGRVFRFQGQILAKSGNANTGDLILAVEAYNGSLGAISYPYENILAANTLSTSTWTQFVGYAVMPTNTCYMAPLFICYSTAANDVFYLDAVVVEDVTLTYKGRVSRISAPGATPSMDTDNYDIFEFTGLATAITSMTTNLTGTPYDGQELSIRFTDNGTARAITWGSKFLSSGSQTLLSTTSAGKTHLVRFLWDATASQWVCWYVDATGYTA